MTDTSAVAVQVTMHGSVQGVRYRGWTVETATALGLAGWVRNRRDGSVEAVFAGPADTVEAMIARCREGPPNARVDAIDRRDVEMPAQAQFRQLPTV
jgi:acylphosphatase